MKVTKEDIKTFNKLYFETKNFSEVARRTGFSASTVRKYVDRNYRPVDENSIKRFDPKLLIDFEPKRFWGMENWNSLIVLSDEEKEEMREIWEEIEI